VPNMMGVLRAEIRRLARKETRQEIARLKKQLTVMRRRVAEARTRLRNLEKATKRAIAVAAVTTTARGAVVGAGEDPGTQIRFSPAWVRSHRKKLRVSRLLYARLLDVSPQTILAWERGRSRPRRKTLETWRAIREMGLRELKGRMSGQGRGADGRRLVARKVLRRRAARKVVRRRAARKSVRRTARRAVRTRARRAKKK
jgi:transcriptional regulator with XRE-family HTH domain